MRYLQTSKDFISIGMVDQAYQLYYFPNFSHDDEIDSIVDFSYTSNFDTNFEDSGQLNLGILVYDKFIEPYIPSITINILSNTILNDTCIHRAMGSSNLVQQSISCLSYSGL